VREGFGRECGHAGIVQRPVLRGDKGHPRERTIKTRARVRSWGMFVERKGNHGANIPGPASCSEIRKDTEGGPDKQATAVSAQEKKKNRGRRLSSDSKNASNLN